MPKSSETYKKESYVVNIVHTKSFHHVKVAKWEINDKAPLVNMLVHLGTFFLFLS